MDKAKEFGLGVVNGEEVTRKKRLVFKVCTDILAPNSPTPMIRMPSLLLVQGGDPPHRSFMAFFRGEV